MTIDLTKFIALHIQGERDGALLTGKLGELVALILDEVSSAPPDPQYTSFAIETYPNGDLHPISLWRRMTYDELTQLATALEAQQHHLPPTLDPAEFHRFVCRVEAELASQPSARFAHARFADIRRDAGGALVAHLGLGIDMVGTVHDQHGAITFEQHVVPMHPGPFHRLVRADRLSLAAAIDAFVRNAPPPVDPRWEQLAHDASR